MIILLIPTLTPTPMKDFSYPKSKEVKFGEIDLKPL